MKRRTVLAALAALMALPAMAQAKVRRIGFLAVRSRPASFDTDLSYGAFVRAMRDLGYVEGRNLAIEWRFADSRYERFPELAADLAKSPIEVLVTHSTPAVRAAQRATSTIPIVSASMSDPVGSGFATTLARPDRNITGLSNINIDVALKQLELVKTALPAVVRVGFLYNSRNPIIAVAVKNVQAASRSLERTVIALDATTSSEIDSTFASLAQQRIGALIVSNDAFFVERAMQIVALALRHRIATVFSYTEYVRNGGLMSYGETLTEIYGRTAVYVDKLLKGAKPADLPIEQPTKLHLAINRQTAKALGIAIPHELLIRADEVIQ
jgi:ABC-type uncharacterized transport system substrate-binding protein